MRVAPMGGYLGSSSDACFDRGAPFFFNTTPRFGSVRPPPKNDLEKKKKNCYEHRGWM